MIALGPCSKHMVDAIKVNSLRASTYKQWSNAQSVEVSDLLIEWEKSLYWSTLLADILCLPLRIFGCRLFYAELVDMNQIAQLPEKPHQLDRPQADQFLDRDISLLQEQLNKALEQNFSALFEMAQSSLKYYESEPRLNCLVRHFLESIRAFAREANTHISKFPAFGRPLLKWIIKESIKQQIQDLEMADVIDKIALPIQLKGIYILYWDVPAIP